MNDEALEADALQEMNNPFANIKPTNFALAYEMVGNKPVKPLGNWTSNDLLD